MKNLILLLFLLPILLLANVVDNLGEKNTIQANESIITNLNAVQSVFNNSSDSENIKICRYSNRTICKVRIRERMPAIIHLPKFEKIQSWVLGDNKNFSFDVLDKTQRKAVLRGLYPGADTNLSIIGESGYIYPFYIRIDSAKSNFLSDFIVNIKLNNKDKNKLLALEAANRKQTLAKLNNDTKLADANKPNITELDYLAKKALINASDLNFDFKQISGDKTITPIKIFDDGIWTYFQYGNKNLIKAQDLPVIYKVKDGFDTPVNSRIEAGYLIAETTADKWTIRSGQKHACIRRGN